MRNAALCLVIGVVAHSALATECSDLAATFKNSRVSLLDESQFATQALAYCNTQTSSGSGGGNGGLNIGYKDFSLGASGSSSHFNKNYSQLCQSQSSLLDQKAAYKEYVTTFDPEAYQTIQKCLDWRTKFITFDVQPSGVVEKSMTFSVLTTNPVPTAKTTVRFQPMEGIGCAWSSHTTALNKDAAILGPSDSVTAVCTRKDGAKSGFVNVSADAAVAPMVIPWDGYQGGAPNHTLSDLQSSVVSLQQQSIALRARQQIESGAFTMVVEPGRRALTDGSKCQPDADNPRGSLHQWVPFSTSFPVGTVPEVVVALSQINEGANGARSMVSIDGAPHNDGFYAQFYTWCNSVIGSGVARYIAYVK